MIKKLHIENFQSHADTELEFDPGVNVIIGQSDSGKSAVIRALNWVCNNKPSGDDYRSDWGGDTSVSIDLPKGISVIREKRGKTGNSYYQEFEGNRSSDGHIEEFKSFGNNVPDEIKEQINMTDINWQRQLDPPFLLSNTAGEVAQKLNEIVNLSVIDSSLASIQRKKRENTQKTNTKEETFEEQKEALEEFKNLPALKVKLDKVTALDEKAFVIDNHIATLEVSVKKMNRIELQIAEKEKIIKFQDAIDKIDALKEEQSPCQSQITTLDSLIDRSALLKEKMEEQQTILDHEDAINEVLEEGRKREKKKRKIDALSSLLSNLTRKTEALEDHDDEFKSLQRKYHDAVDELEICPLCGKERDV